MEVEKEDLIIKSTDYSLELWGGFFTQPICLAPYNVNLVTSLTPSLNITVSWLNDNPLSVFDVSFKKKTETEYTVSGTNVTSPHVIDSVLLESDTLYDIKIKTVGWKTTAFAVKSIKTAYLNIAPVISSITLSSNNVVEEILLQQKPVISSIQLSNTII